jgi:SAM-dependent methyltransferase
MLREAARIQPHKPVHCGPATEIARLGVTFDAVFCLHLAMHLPMAELRAIIAACEDSVRRGGVLIVDAPSALRRRLVGFHATGWHGSTAFNTAQLADLAGPGWRLVATRGLMFFPVHRIPALLRSWVRPVDTLLGISPVKSLASYNLFLLQRQ